MNVASVSISFKDGMTKGAAGLSSFVERVLEVSANFVFDLLTNGYFWVAFLLVIFFRFIKKRWDKRSHWLSKRVDRELNEMRLQKLSNWQTFKRWLLDGFSELYAPELFTGVAISLFAIIVFLASNFEYTTKWPWFNFTLGSATEQNLITIHAGIGAIIFALLLFVAESLRAEDSKDRARVLLKESFLLPLTIAEILIFFNLILVGPKDWNVGLIILVGIATIVSLWRLISILLNPYRFKQRLQSLLKSRIKKSINLAVRERVADTLFEKILENGPMPQWFLMSSDEIETSFDAFKSSKLGVVTDINVQALKDFSERVEKIANLKNYTFIKEKDKTPSSAGRPRSSSTISSQLPTQETGTQPKFQYLEHGFYVLKKFNDIVSERNNFLICVKKGVLEKPEDLKDLEALAKEIFVIKPGADTFGEEVKSELEGLGDKLIAVLGEGQTNKIEELIENHIQLAEAFLELFKDYGGGYDPEQAKKERSSLLSWREIQGLSSNVREAIVKALTLQDKNIISKVIYLPFVIAKRAIESEDHYLYQQFIGFSEFCYAQVVNERPQHLKFVTETLANALRDVARYHIEPDLNRKSLAAEKISKHSFFGLHLFLTLQGLLKEAFDKDDREGFGLFLETQQNLFHHFIREHEYNLELGANKEAGEARKVAAEALKTRKNQSIFGLAAWTLFKYRKEKVVENQYFYEQLEPRLPTKMKELATLYLASRQFDVEGEMQWQWWELIPDGEVHSIDFDSKIDWLFIVRALNIISQSPEEGSVELPHNRNLVYQIKEDGSLAKILSILETETGNLSDILPRSDLGNLISKLRVMLQRAAEAQEAEEADFLKNVEIKKEKVESFVMNFQEGFSSNSSIRTLANIFGAFEDRSQDEKIDKSKNLWGINTIDYKEAFIDNWHVHFPDWGKEYGRSLAQSEDSLMFGAITKAIKYGVSCKKEDLVKNIEKNLPKEDLKDLIVIGDMSFDLEWDILNKSTKFIKRDWRAPQRFDALGNYFLGHLELRNEKIPVFNLRAKDGIENNIFIFSMKKLAKLIQLPPFDTLITKEHQYGIFQIKVRDLNKEPDTVAAIIAKKPEWLQKHKDQEGYLKQRVILNIFERFNFEILDKTHGYRITVED